MRCSLGLRCLPRFFPNLNIRYRRGHWRLASARCAQPQVRDHHKTKEFYVQPYRHQQLTQKSHDRVPSEGFIVPSQSRCYSGQSSTFGRHRRCFHRIEVPYRHPVHLAHVHRGMTSTPLPGQRVLANSHQARMSCRTCPCTSVSRKSRPPER